MACDFTVVVWHKLLLTAIHCLLTLLIIIIRLHAVCRCCLLLHIVACSKDSLCLSVDCTGELCKNGYSDRDAV